MSRIGDRSLPETLLPRAPVDPDGAPEDEKDENTRFAEMLLRVADGGRGEVRRRDPGTPGAADPSVAPWLVPPLPPALPAASATETDRATIEARRAETASDARFPAAAHAGDRPASRERGGARTADGVEAVGVERRAGLLEDAAAAAAGRGREGDRLHEAPAGSLACADAAGEKAATAPLAGDITAAVELCHEREVPAAAIDCPADMLASVGTDGSAAGPRPLERSAGNRRDGEDDAAGGSGAERHRFGEVLLAHIVEAAAELAGPRDAAEGATPTAHHAGSGAPADPPVHHAHLGAAHAELVFGDGADRVQVTVAMDQLGVHVHAHVASGELASVLLGGSDELRAALQRHGLDLCDFSASDGRSDRDEGDDDRRGGRRGAARPGDGGRGRRRGVRVIL